MKSAFILLAVAGIALGAQATSQRTAAHAAGPAPIGAREYVRLTDWAKANGLQMRSLKRNEMFQLSNSSRKLTFAVDSREAQVNGVGVWLSFPFALREGIACV